MTAVKFLHEFYLSLLWTQRNGINFVMIPDVNAPAIIEQIKAIEPDLIVSVSMNQIVKKEIL